MPLSTHWGQKVSWIEPGMLRSDESFCAVGRFQAQTPTEHVQSVREEARGREVQSICAHLHWRLSRGASL